MLYRDISRTLSFFLFWLALPLAFPLVIAIYCEWIAPSGRYPQPPAAMAFLITIALTLCLGYFFRLLGKNSVGHLFRREALLLVLIVWFLTPAVSALPFYLNGTFRNPLNAYFEAVSGFTTTGATTMEAKKFDPETGGEIPIEATFCVGEPVLYSYYGTIEPVRSADGAILLEGIEAVSPALLFWRSFTQWLGGGGIIVLFVAILPALGVGGKILYQTEVTGPSKESMTPRIKETASQLWKIYLGLTLAQVFLLILTNKQMPLFDAITLSFSTISTGGMSIKTDNIAYYNNIYTEGVVLLFMILGSISFSIYFFCMRGKFSRLNDPELKVFLTILVLISAFGAYQLYRTPIEGVLNEPPTASYTLGQSIRYGAFQMVSAITSTGFTSINYKLWPFSNQVLLFIVMFIGGMAGSTAGGLKVIRLQMFFKIMLHKIESIFRPDTVRTYRIGSSIIDQKVGMTVLCYFLVAAALTILGTFLLVIDGVDPETSLTAIGSLINNVGIAFRMAGPEYSFAFLSNFGKLLGSLWMIAGRLEFFAVLIALIPAFWRGR